MRPFFQGLRFEIVFFQPPKVSAQEGEIEPNDKHKQCQQIGYEDGVKAHQFGKEGLERICVLARRDKFQCEGTENWQKSRDYGTILLLRGIHPWRRFS